MKTCENCGIGFAPKRVDARVCGPDCGRVLCMNCQFRARAGEPFPNER